MMIPFITYQIDKTQNFYYTLYRKIDVPVILAGKDINLQDPNWRQLGITYQNDKCTHLWFNNSISQNLYYKYIHNIWQDLYTHIWLFTAGSFVIAKD